MNTSPHASRHRRGLLGFTMAANAQTTPKEPVQPSVPGMVEHDQPVMDREIFAHFLLNQNEGRFGRLDGKDTHYRWNGRVGSAPITTNSGSKPKGPSEAARSKTASTNFSIRARSRPISISRAGLRSDLDSTPHAQLGGVRHRRASHPISSMSSSPVM